MYTTDGLWFNLIWYDGLFILLAIIYIIVGPMRIRKKERWQSFSISRDNSVDPFYTHVYK